jgi:hypothetical protein
MHVRLVSHQSFPHLWKKLWKSAKSARSGLNSAVFTRRCFEAKVKNRDISGLAAMRDPLHRAKSTGFGGEAAATAVFTRK